MWYRATVTIFSESRIGTCDLTSASILMGKMGQNIWNWDCPGKLRTYGLRMYGAGCYFKGTEIHALLFSAPVNSKQPSFLAWGSLHWSPEPNSTRQDVSRVSLTKRKGPALVMFKSAVFALSDSSLPSPPCSLYQNGYIWSTLAFCLQLKVDQWEVPPRRQEREELGVLISWFPSCGFTITKDCLLHGSPHTTFSGIQ